MSATDILMQQMLEASKRGLRVCYVSMEMSINNDFMKKYKAEEKDKERQ